MNSNKQKIINRKRRHGRVRAKIKGNSVVPRVAVFKSSQHIYAQVIDDEKRITLLSVSDSETKGKNKTQKSLEAGEKLGANMKKSGIEKAVFDRGGFKYHGRVKSLADGLRNAGIKI